MSFKDLERRLRKQELVSGVGQEDRTITFMELGDPRIEGSKDKFCFRIHVPGDQRIPCRNEFIDHTNEKEASHD